MSTRSEKLQAAPPCQFAFAPFVGGVQPHFERNRSLPSQESAEPGVADDAHVGSQVVEQSASRAQCPALFSRMRPDEIACTGSQYQLLPAHDSDDSRVASAAALPSLSVLDCKIEI